MDTNENEIEVEVSSDRPHVALVPLWLLSKPLPGKALHLYVLLAGKFGNWETGVSWVGRTRLADELGCSVDTVDRAVKTLTGEVGALSVEQRHDDKGQTTNLWKVAWSEPVPKGGRINAAGGSRKNAAQTKPTTNQNPYSPHSAARGLCERFCVAVEEHLIARGLGGLRPSVTERSISEMSKLLRDGPRVPRGMVNEGEPPTPEQVRKAIEWLFSDTGGTVEWQNGSCWADQIRTPGKLRAKYLDLRLAASRTGTATGKPDASKRPSVPSAWMETA